MAEARVALAGVHGHGWWHLANLRRLQAEQKARLVGVCEVAPVEPDLLADFGLEAQSSSLSEVLDRARPDILVIATPIHTHAELAATAARAGVHLLLEKPPAPTFTGYEGIVDAVATTGIACQVGFQSLGSAAVDRAVHLVRSGEIGAVKGISAAGAWQRDSTYYTRARWAGRRTLDGVDVVDGALTNPFAHALATALRVDGNDGDDLAGAVELELWHAYDIDSDDTAALRLRTSRGTTITVAVTLCAADPGLPYIVIHGERGRAVLWYNRDQLSISDGPTVTYGRVDLLENLIAHLADPDVPLIVPLASTRAFMQAVEAVRLAPSPRPVPSEFVDARPVQNEVGSAERRTVPGIEDLVRASADRLALFSELDAPWAKTAHPTGTVTG
jgi:predicted dehydrogenase